MFLRPCYRIKDGKRHAYWALVESVRTARGPRQRVVAYLGQVGPQRRQGVQRAAGSAVVPSLFEDSGAEWVEVDARRVHLERCLDFGGPWLGLEILRKLEFMDFLEEIMPPGRAEIPWPGMAMVLVLCRLCHPSSELHIAEHLYGQTAIADLLGIPTNKINEQRLYRALDKLLVEKAMHERFARRIEEGLRQLDQACARRNHRAVTIATRLGQLLGRNSRAAGLFETDVTTDSDGRARLLWRKVDAWQRWAELSEGCYLLRSNVADWTAEELWEAYMHLTDAEEAFRIHKTDLGIRPIWHQKEERVDAHILVCFLAYVAWKTLGQMCRRAWLGDEPRRVLHEIGRIRLVDVVLPTRDGTEIRRRCVTRPDDHQAILLHRLGLNLPSSLPMADEKIAKM